MSGQKPGDPGSKDGVPEDEEEVAKTVMVANPFLVGKTDPGPVEITQVGAKPANPTPLETTSSGVEEKTKVASPPGVKAKPATPAPKDKRQDEQQDEEQEDEQEDQEFNGRTVIAKPPFAHVPADRPLSDQARFQPLASQSTAAMQRLVEEQRRKEEELPGPDWDDSKLVRGTDLEPLKSDGTSLVERPQKKNQPRAQEADDDAGTATPPASGSSAEPSERPFRTRTFILAGLIVVAGVGAAAFLFLLSGPPESANPSSTTAQTGTAVTSPIQALPAATQPVAPVVPVATSPVAATPATAPPATAPVTTPPTAPPSTNPLTVTPPPASALPPPVNALPAPVTPPKTEHKTHKAEPAEKIVHEEKIPKPATSKKAFLVIQAPAGVMILIDGKDTGKKTPLSGPMEVPPGDRFVTLVSSAGQKKGYAVSIEAGETYTLSETF